jgi:TonB family protein
MNCSAFFSSATTMQPLIHSLNIGTLATWLSVAGFGAVGVMVPEWKHASAAPLVEETTVFDEDFMLGDTASADGGGAVEAVPLEQVEPLPAPPETPAVADFTPLPEVPELPQPALAAQAKPSTVTRVAGATPSPRPSVARRTGQGAVGSPGRSGGDSASSGMSNADRLAAGRMPAPNYPPECRRKGQTGTVLVEFTVDTSGRVISAYAKSPSPWAQLNHEAVSTVRRWKFPPGGIMKLQRPIVFQLR